MARILAFAGSARRDSLNKRLLAVAVEKARAAGAEVTALDLAELPLPLYDADRETAQGIPDNAVRLQELMRSHHGFLLACPEYNGSLTPLFKNAVDWASRRAPGEPPLVAYRGKVATLLAASPGTLGGLRGLVPARALLANLGVLVLPTQLAVPRADKAFDADGSLADRALDARLGTAVRELVDTARKLFDGS